MHLAYTVLLIRTDGVIAYDKTRLQILGSGPVTASISIDGSIIESVISFIYSDSL